MRLAWILLAATALALGSVSYGYLIHPQDFEPPFRVKYLAHLGLVLTHGILGIVALMLGPFLFMPGLRQRWPGFHRVAGAVYYLAVLISAVTGLPMALMAEGGPAARCGFCLLDLGWLVTALLSLGALRRRRYRTHGVWMTRNYALSFSAVTLRVGLALLQEAGLSWDFLYPRLAWGAWLLNLALAEAVLASLQSRARRAYTERGLSPRRNTVYGQQSA